MGTDRLMPTGAARTTRYLAAVLLLGLGAVHLQQFFAVYYRVIPVIGPLFAVNFAFGVILGLALLVPIERVARPLPVLAALGGIAFAAGTLIGLLISESGTLFGFHEHGYRTAVVVSIALEGAAIVSLAGYLLLLGRSRSGSRRHTAAPSAAPNPSI